MIVTAHLIMIVAYVFLSNNFYFRYNYNNRTFSVHHPYGSKQRVEITYLWYRPDNKLFSQPANQKIFISLNRPGLSETPFLERMEW